MNKLREYLGEYCQLALGAETHPKGLEHNTEFADFSSQQSSASILLGYDERNNSIVVGADGNMDAWLLVSKAEGKLEGMDMATGIDVYMATDLVDIKELLIENISTKDTSQSAENQKVLDVLKTDLVSNNNYLDRMYSGNFSSINTIEEEINFLNSWSKGHPNKDYDEAASLLEKIKSFTNPSKELNPSDIESSVKEVVKIYRQLSDLKNYQKERLTHLTQIYAARLYAAAQTENSQIDLFDSDNCNLRLRLASWRDTLKNYQAEIEAISSHKSLPTESIFVGPYMDYAKKLQAACYMRDEVIRFGRGDGGETDGKLQAFNEKRKTEQMSAKQERDYFFKDFSNNIMAIISHVSSDILPNLGTDPKETLQSLKQWHNVLNFKKNTPEVKQIRETITSSIDKIYGTIQDMLKKLANESSTSVEFLRRWEVVSQEIANYRSLLSSVVESLSEDVQGKFNQFENQVDSILSKILGEVESELNVMRSSNKRDFEVATGSRVDYSFEDGLYPFVATDLKFDNYYALFLKIEQSGLSKNLPQPLIEISNNILKLRVVYIQMKQVCQQMTFNVEKADEAIITIIKDDPALKTVGRFMASKAEGGQIILGSPSSAQAFLNELTTKIGVAVLRINELSGSLDTLIHNIGLLSNYKLYKNVEFWKAKISESRILSNKV